MEQPTPKQIALLNYLKEQIPTTKHEASRLITHILDNTRRAESWNVDRLVLHPELYPEEVAAMKDRRARDLWNYANGQAGDPNHHILRITQAEAKDAVNWLDANIQGWDKNLYMPPYGTVRHSVMAEFFCAGVASTHPYKMKKGRYVKIVQDGIETKYSNRRGGGVEISRRKHRSKGKNILYGFIIFVLLIWILGMILSS